MAFKMNGWSGYQKSPMKNYKKGYYNDDEVSGFKKTNERNESAFKTHEGPDKPHKPTKFDKFAKKVGEYSAKIGLGPIYGGTKWMMGKTDKPNIVKAIDFVKSKFNKNKDE